MLLTTDLKDPYGLQHGDRWHRAKTSGFKSAYVLGPIPLIRRKSDVLQIAPLTLR